MFVKRICPAQIKDDFVLPISSAEFSALMTKIETFCFAGEGIAVAVSGGADSSALMELMREWSLENKTKLFILTVDHKLRTSSRREALAIREYCLNIGLEHHLLEWFGEKPKSGVQAAARTARYNLMRDWCRERSVQTIMVGHTIEDQAETFLLRMSRGSGARGLSGMPLVSTSGGINIVRPLLGISRQRLLATLKTKSIRWIDDPSNVDCQFERVKIREKTIKLRENQISPSSIAAVARVFGELRALRDRDNVRILNSIGKFHDEGFIDVDRNQLFNLNVEKASRFILASLIEVGGIYYPPRRKRLQRLMNSLESSGIVKATLGGCIIVSNKNRLRIFREFNTISDVRQVNADCVITWDGRFLVSFKSKLREHTYQIGALGKLGWQSISNVMRDNRSLPPGPVRVGLPAIWKNNKVIEVPHLDFVSREAESSCIKKISFLSRSNLKSMPFWVA